MKEFFHPIRTKHSLIRNQQDIKPRAHFHPSHIIHVFIASKIVSSKIPPKCVCRTACQMNFIFVLALSERKRTFLSHPCFRLQDARIWNSTVNISDVAITSTLRNIYGMRISCAIPKRGENLFDCWKAKQQRIFTSSSILYYESKWMTTPVAVRRE